MLSKQNKIIFSIIAVLIAQNITAQVTDFKLSDFKYRTPGFKALGFTGKTNSSYSTGGGNSGSFELFPQINYLSQQSTDKIQQSLSISAAASYSMIGGNSDKQRRLGAGTTVDFLLRQFKDKYFIETGIKGNVNYGSTNYTTQKRKELTNPYSLQLTLGAGKGRLENVSDAQMALFILDDLKKAGKIKGTVSKEKAAAFASLLTQVYNKRIFDFRKRRMYEMEQINAFLKTNKLIDADDITVFNIISDNWAFAIQPNAIDGVTASGGGTLIIDHLFNNVSDRYNLDGIFGQPSRYSGKQLFARLLPAANTSNDIKKTITDTTSIKSGNINYGATVQIGYDERKPINMLWQFDKHAVLSYNNSSAKDVFTNLVNKYSGVTADVGVELGYYPNSRTVVRGFGTLAALYRLNNSAGTGKFGLSPGVRLDANYFVNYNARLTGSFSANYFSKNYGTFSNSVSFNFDLSYRIYIF
jgi:hypothetical protein